MKSTFFPFSKILSAIVVLWLGFAFSVEALKDFECYDVWSSASTKNDIMSCIFSMQTVKNNWTALIFPAVAALTFILILFFVPPLFCSCSCCCGEERGSRISKQALVFGFSIGGALLGSIFLIFGGIIFNSSYSNALDSFLNEASKTPLHAKESIVDALSNYSVTPPTPPAIDLSSFDSLEQKFVEDLKRITDVFPLIVMTVVPCVLASVLVLLTVLALFSTARCWNRVACVVVWVYYILALLLCILTVVSGAFVILTNGLCGEVNLQFSRDPGIFQWYVVPLVEEMASFSPIADDLQKSFEKAVTDGCTMLLSKCTPPTEQVTNKPFVCGLSTCSSLSDLVTSTQNAYVPVSNSPMFCSNSLVNNYKCTVSYCAEYCIDTMKVEAVQVLDSLDTALNASNALSYVTPYLTANYLVDLGVSVLQSPATSSFAYYSHGKIDNCVLLIRSSTILEVGFYVAAITLFFQAVVLMRIYRIFARHKSAVVHEPFFDEISDENLSEQESRKNR